MVQWSDIVERGRKALKKSGAGGNSSENGYSRIPPTVANEQLVHFLEFSETWSFG
jgi:hypothetical protein